MMPSGSNPTDDIGDAADFVGALFPHIVLEVEQKSGSCSSSKSVNILVSTTMRPRRNRWCWMWWWWRMCIVRVFGIIAPVRQLVFEPRYSLGNLLAVLLAEIYVAAPHSAPLPASVFSDPDGPFDVLLVEHCGRFWTLSRMPIRWELSALDSHYAHWKTSDRWLRACWFRQAC